MKDNGNTTIALLTVTAVILVTMLVGTYLQTSQTALAEGPARSGNYIMATARWNVDVHLVYVINLAARKLNIYYPNYDPDNETGGAIELVDSIDLEQAFAF